MAAVTTPATIQTCECHVYLLQGVGKADTPSLCETHEPEQPIHKRATRIPGGRSCITQLLSVLEEWTDALDKGVAIDTIYFDFAQAFVTVPHRRLVAKLVSYQISR